MCLLQSNKLKAEIAIIAGSSQIFTVTLLAISLVTGFTGAGKRPFSVLT